MIYLIFPLFFGTNLCFFLFWQVCAQVPQLPAGLVPEGSLVQCVTRIESPTRRIFQKMPNQIQGGKFTAQSTFLHIFPVKDELIFDIDSCSNLIPLAPKRWSSILTFLLPYEQCLGIRTAARGSHTEKAGQWYGHKFEWKYEHKIYPKPSHACMWPLSMQTKMHMSVSILFIHIYARRLSRLPITKHRYVCRWLEIVNVIDAFPFPLDLLH